MALEVNGNQNYSDMLRDIITPQSISSPQDQPSPLHYLNDPHVPYVSPYYDVTNMPASNTRQEHQHGATSNYLSYPSSRQYSYTNSLYQSSDPEITPLESNPPFQYPVPFPLFHSSLSSLPPLHNVQIPPLPQILASQSPQSSLLSQILTTSSTQPHQISLIQDPPVQSPQSHSNVIIPSSPQPVQPLSPLQPLSPAQPIQPTQPIQTNLPAHTPPLSPAQPAPASTPTPPTPTQPIQAVQTIQLVQPAAPTPVAESPSPQAQTFLQDSQATECTETPTPPIASHPIFTHSDSINEFLELVSKKEKPPISLPPLPPSLGSVPVAHQTSNPLLPTFFPVPGTPSPNHASPRFSTSPTAPARSHYINSSSESGDVPMFSFVESASLPPILSPRSRSSSLTSTKEEPLASEFAKPQKFEPNTPSIALNQIVPPVKESGSPNTISAEKVMAREVEAENIHSKALYSSSIMYTHAHQLSDIRLKDDVTPISGGMDVIRNLHPVSYNWKPGALEMALTMKPEPDNSPYSLSTKDITKANTRANTYIVPKNEDYSTSTNNNNNNNYHYNNNTTKATTKHVNYSDPSPPSPPPPFPSSSSSSSFSSTASSSKTFSPPSMVRATSVPACLHPSTGPHHHHPAVPMRASSELHLFHHNYQYYREQEDKYDSDYTDDSDDFSDMEDDDDYDELMNESKKVAVLEENNRENKYLHIFLFFFLQTVGFIAQDVRNACPNLVNENPQTSVLTIDTVGKNLSIYS